MKQRKIRMGLQQKKISKKRILCMISALLHIAALALWGLMIYQMSAVFGRTVMIEHFDNANMLYWTLTAMATAMLFSVFILWNLSDTKHPKRIPVSIVIFFASGILLRLFYLIQGKTCNQQVLTLYFIFCGLFALMIFVKSMLYYKHNQL